MNIDFKTILVCVIGIILGLVTALLTSCATMTDPSGLVDCKEYSLQRYKDLKADGYRLMGGDVVVRPNGIVLVTLFVDYTKAMVKEEILVDTASIREEATKKGFKHMGTCQRGGSEWAHMTQDHKADNQAIE